MKEKLNLKDFLDYKFIGSPKYNEAGDVLAFIVSNANIDDNNYESFIYIYKDGVYSQLTASGKEGYFYFEDNETIIFKNMRDQKDLDRVKAGEDLSVFYRININGGEARKAFSIPLKVSNIEVLSDNQLLLSVLFNKDYSIAYNMNEADKKALLERKKEMADYQVFEQVPFYSNGQGYVNNDRNVLFTYDLKTEALDFITEENVDVSIVRYDKENQNIYFSATNFEKVLVRKQNIYVYNSTRKTTSLVLDDQLSIRDFNLNGDNILIVGSLGDKFGINQNPDFYSLDLKTKDLDLVLNHDASVGSSVGSDCRLTGGQQAKFVDNKYYFVSTINNGSVLQVLDNNQISTIIDLSGSIDSFDIAGDQIALVALKDGKLQELYINDQALEQVTKLNEAVLVDKYVAEYEELNFERDGYLLNGWVLKPKDYDASKSYPAILDIHGGPKTVYGPVFYHEMQVWANAGAFVFFMNPRGSDGRGNEFADIRGKYGTGDYDDLMLFTDKVLAKYPAINPANVAVTGGSYGGFMTNWIIGHTERFVAAASQRSISNWIGFTYTSDIGPYFATDQQAANMFDDIDKLWWHSPLKYARNVKTPTLFIHSDEDYRCPSFEAMQMYGALMEANVESKLVMFKGENHDLSRTGRPKQRIKRLEEITDWLFNYFN